MQSSPKHSPLPGSLLPKACSVALAHPKDTVAAELASAGKGAISPDHLLPLARTCLGAAGTCLVPIIPWEPQHFELLG